MNHIGLSGYSSGYNPLVFGQSGCSFNVYVCMCVDIHSKRARGPCIHSKRARGQFIHPLSLNVPAGKVGVHSFQARPRARLRARGRVRGHYPFAPAGTIRSLPTRARARLRARERVQRDNFDLDRKDTRCEWVGKFSSSAPFVGYAYSTRRTMHVSVSHSTANRLFHLYRTRRASP